MKKGHSVRFCKIRKYSVPRGFMKWIPKGCEVFNCKEKPKGPKFLRDYFCETTDCFSGSAVLFAVFW